MDRRVPAATFGVLGMGALFAPSVVDELLAGAIPFFLGFGPGFVHRFGATFVVLAVVNEAVTANLDDVRFSVACAVAFVTTGAVTIGLALGGIDVVGDGDGLLAISHAVPYLFAAARTRRQRLSVVALTLVLPFAGYATLETLYGAPATRHAVVMTLVGISFGLPLAVLGRTTKTRDAPRRFGPSST